MNTHYYITYYVMDTDTNTTLATTRLIEIAEALVEALKGKHNCDIRPVQCSW